MDFRSGAELLEQHAVRGTAVSEAARQRECDLTDVSMEDTETRMKDILTVMRDSATLPLKESVTSTGGLAGGELVRMEERRGESTSTLSGVLNGAVTYVMAVLEVSISMGLIMAVPTAGSSGIMPGLLLALQEEYGLEDDLVAGGLSATSAIGYLAMCNAIVLEVVGGYQTEVGVAYAVAAATAVEPTGGTPAQNLDTASATLMNLLGLVCDPVGNLVECPCQNRNGAGAANALIYAETALDDIWQLIPFDEMLETVYTVGRGLPLELRGAALGGCAATPSGCRMGRCVQKA